MKKYKIMFWISTGIIFLMQGVMPIVGINSALTVQTFAYLGYPIYFGVMLAIFKGLGATALILPQVSGRIKEWAYAGFGFDFISALISLLVVGGFTGNVFLPIIFIIILIISYVSYDKMKQTNIIN